MKVLPRLDDARRSPKSVMHEIQTKPLMRGLIASLLFVVAGCGPLHGYSVEEWWSRMVEVDASEFSDIKHFTLQGVDYSHHFRFTFTNRSDLDKIICRHNLGPDLSPMRFSSESLPRWFEPPASADAFSNGGSDPSVVLWIDDDDRVAYFELVKI